jgi:hypothetical protein
MNSWPNFKSFRPKKSQNRTNIGEIQKFFIFYHIFWAKLDTYGASANDAFKFLSLRVKYLSL